MRVSLNVYAINDIKSNIHYLVVEKTLSLNPSFTMLLNWKYKKSIMLTLTTLTRFFLMLLFSLFISLFTPTLSSSPPSSSSSTLLPLPSYIPLSPLIPFSIPVHLCNRHHQHQHPQKYDIQYRRLNHSQQNKVPITTSNTHYQQQ